MRQFSAAALYVFCVLFVLTNQRLPNAQAQGKE